MKILGISCFYHDSAACLRRRRRDRRRRPGGALHAQEARPGLPRERGALLPRRGRRSRARASTRWPSTTSRSSSSTASSRPTSRSRRAACAPFMQAVPLWLREKLWIEPRDPGGARSAAASGAPEKLYFPEHHESHAASAFYPSPFQEAAMLTIDGVGEWATATVGVGEGNDAAAARGARASRTRSACSTRPSPTSPASRSTPPSTS